MRQLSTTEEKIKSFKGNFLPQTVRKILLKIYNANKIEGKLYCKQK